MGVGGCVCVTVFVCVTCVILLVNRSKRTLSLPRILCTESNYLILSELFWSYYTSDCVCIFKRRLKLTKYDEIDVYLD